MTSLPLAPGLGEKNLYISLLEMRAILLTLHAFQNKLICHTVGLMRDNTSVLMYINKLERTILSSLYLLVKQVLTWAKSNAVTCYIMGLQNVIVD